jgi:hypothetical protein
MLLSEANLIILTKLIAALRAVVENGGTFVGGPKLKCVEIHLFVAATGALFFDGGLPRALIIVERGGSVDKLALLSQC